MDSIGISDVRNTLPARDHFLIDFIMIRSIIAERKHMLPSQHDEISTPPSLVGSRSYTEVPRSNQCKHNIISSGEKLVNSEITRIK